MMHYSVVERRVVSSPCPAGRWERKTGVNMASASESEPLLEDVAGGDSSVHGSGESEGGPFAYGPGKEGAVGSRPAPPPSSSSPQRSQKRGLHTSATAGGRKAPDSGYVKSAEAADVWASYHHGEGARGTRGVARSGRTRGGVGGDSVSGLAGRDAYAAPVQVDDTTYGEALREAEEEGRARMERTRWRGAAQPAAAGANMGAAESSASTGDPYFTVSADDLVDTPAISTPFTPPEEFLAVERVVRGESESVTMKPAWMRESEAEAPKGMAQQEKEAKAAAAAAGAGGKKRGRKKATTSTADSDS